MLHDKATISQSLARGFDLCGWRGGGAAGGGAGECCSRATGPSSTLAFGLADSRFPPRLLDPFSDLLLQAELRLPRATVLASRCSELHWWEWGGGSSLQPRRACIWVAAAGRRLSGEKEGDRIPSPRVGSWAGVCCRDGLFVVVFIPGTSKPLL